MRRPLILFLAALVAVGHIAQAAAQAPKASEPAALEIKCRKNDDAIKVSRDGGKTLLSVTSKSGIGGASVERKAEHWPQELVLRLHLRGLESLTISGGDLRLAASVLSHSGNARLLHLPKDGTDGPQLDKSSPYWMDIQTLDAEGKPIKGLPRDGGWFEMRVPKALLVDQTKVVTLGWIDFYR